MPPITSLSSPKDTFMPNTSMVQGPRLRKEGERPLPPLQTHPDGLASQDLQTPSDPPPPLPRGHEEEGEEDEEEEEGQVPASGGPSHYQPVDTYHIQGPGSGEMTFGVPLPSLDPARDTCHPAPSSPLTHAHPSVKSYSPQSRASPSGSHMDHDRQRFPSGPRMNHDATVLGGMPPLMTQTGEAEGRQDERRGGGKDAFSFSPSLESSSEASHSTNISTEPRLSHSQDPLESVYPIMEDPRVITSKKRKVLEQREEQVEELILEDPKDQEERLIRERRQKLARLQAQFLPQTQPLLSTSRAKGKFRVAWW
ncbi:hypothetical protein BJ684DRAFT_20119 [Piptocephalis cylindrospora]|uniref:Uncharacterized protein n=1 Tax=Piptocephalis cylindrospora TaxID=1907219 RepID=A0A4P9Y5C9_9FUNG|nr:hypothetical protein BJ684DRAFT_20119 [Piptocephalis cylindrospora]|eukprot:RKP13391.1 hypothetical protein BJ684DRAFT_20119 [Piptocephalis cylindrospora]